MQFNKIKKTWIISDNPENFRILSLAFQLDYLRSNTICITEQLFRLVYTDVLPVSSFFTVCEK